MPYYFTQSADYNAFAMRHLMFTVLKRSNGHRGSFNICVENQLWSGNLRFGAISHIGTHAKQGFRLFSRMPVDITAVLATQQLSIRNMRAAEIDPGRSFKRSRAAFADIASRS
jgi:hypothetical protein